MTEEELREIHLPPYISAIDDGVGSVMISYNSWNGVKCHGNSYLINDVLKDELGFDGFVISDWKGINQVNGDFKEAIKTSVNAGVDMAMQPDDYIPFIDLLKQLVNEGQVSMDRIDDAVSRILEVKMRLGLFENPYAEGNGDLIGNVGGYGLSSEDQQMLQAVKNAGIPYTVILLSGRPLDIQDELEDADAFITAWLPGTEGGSGIADVIFGDFEPTGKLSHPGQNHTLMYP